MTDNAAAAQARQILAESDSVFVIIANAEGEVLTFAGNLHHDAFTDLLSMLAGGPEEIQCTYRCLDTTLLPRIWTQGDARVFIHRPIEALLVFVGVLLPRGDSSPESFARSTYARSIEVKAIIEQSIANA